MRGLERGIERAMQRQHQYDSDNGEGTVSQVHNPITVAAFVEIEAFVIENLVRQMEQGVLAPTPVWSNLKTFPSQEFSGRVHGITGGYPCQPFSVAGKRNGREDARHLWPHIFGIVTTVRPLWCFFENVPGHITSGFREVRSQLQSLGYKVERGIFSAEEAGAPHQRKRLFILAVDNAHRDRLKQEYQIQARRNTVEYSGEGELANSNNNGKSARSGKIKSQSKEIEGTEQREERDEVLRERMRTKSGNESSGIKLANTEHNGHLTTEERESIEARNGRNQKRENSAMQSEGCSELANAKEFGVEGNRSEGKQKSEVHAGEKISECYSGGDRWPARPGEQQYEWEEPRTESSLGFTVNGYNYREDLLRMAGNGVVEQAAEVAWRTLWQKIF
jgi:DNA (cytosine-5)-methyltransferase 1